MPGLIDKPSPNRPPTLLLSDHLIRRFHRASRLANLTVLSIAGVVLIGWILGLDRLKSGAPNLTAMNPTTAVLFIASGLSMWLIRDATGSGPKRRIGILLALLPLAAGAAKLVAIGHGPELNIDRLLFPREIYWHDPRGNPMALLTAGCFVLAGLALATIDLGELRGLRLSTTCAIGCGALALLAVIGYAYRISKLYGTAWYFPMAPHTAVAFLVLAVGLLFARPQQGLMGVLSSRGAAGQLARRLIPAALVIPALMGYLRLLAEHHGLLSSEMGLPLVVSANTVFFTALVWWNLMMLGQAEARRTGVEDELRNSEARLRLIINTANDAFVSMDSAGQIISWNPRAKETFGWPQSEVLGKKLSETIIPPQYRAAHESGLRNFLATGTGPVLGTRLELSALHRDGREFPVELTISPAMDQGSHLFFAFIHDISKRKRLEEERDRFFTLARDLVCVAGMDGYFKRVNGAFENTLGYTPAEMLGRPWLDFVHPDDVARTVAEGQKLSAGAVSLYFENRYRCKDGTWKWLAWTCVPIVKEEKIYAVARDMTERKRAQEELEAKNNDLESAVRSEREAREALQSAQSQLVQAEKLAGLGQMVAGVAHEINNPLSFVSNNVAVLERDLKAIIRLLEMHSRASSATDSDRSALQREIADLSERIDLKYTVENLGQLLLRSRDGLKRIQQIVKDLRDFARLDQAELQEADLNSGIVSTINIIRGFAKSRQIEIATDLAPLPSIRCFAAKINQVLMNLLTNAIHASHEGGRVVVRTSPTPDRAVSISVIDEGKGIDPAIRDRIFDPFFTTKPPGEGTGLGLSISYGIVQAHGGKIIAESEVGKGSTFTVQLPRHLPDSRGEDSNGEVSKRLGAGSTTDDS